MAGNHVSQSLRDIFLFPHVAVVSCGDPGTPADGVRFGTDFTFNKTVSYRCSPGHILEPAAAATLRCTAGGAWNHSKPVCKGPCAAGRVLLPPPGSRSRVSSHSLSPRTPSPSAC